jgi:Ca2+-binding RTX toxin-like protein
MAINRTINLTMATISVAARATICSPAGTAMTNSTVPGASTASSATPGNDILNAGHSAGCHPTTWKHWTAATAMTCLSAGLGADRMTGGAGLDTFFFESIQDTLHFEDDIIDFVQGEDRIDVSAIDANVSLAGTIAPHPLPC